MVSVILFVCYTVISKRHVADHHVKEIIGICGFLESVHRNVRFLIKLFCDSSRDAVKLHTVQTAVLHFLR